MRAPCDCQARFDRLAAADTSTAYGELSTALLTLATIKRATRCGCIVGKPYSPARAELVALCAAAVDERKKTL
ncbi:MAG: hypothetical protein ACPGR8_17035 [Limisphaerales bacterium]